MLQMNEQPTNEDNSGEPLIPSGWLVRCVSIREVEAKHIYNGILFGFCHREWVALRSKMLPGDELWEFSNGPIAWDELMGIGGYAVLRNGEVTDMIITELN
jgi:hypothetical protein